MSEPLDDLEMHELLRLMYPDLIRSDDDAYFTLSQDICNDVTVYLGDGFEPTLAEFIGRLVMLTMPMRSGLTERLSHCVGSVKISNGEAHMIAAVRRDVIPPQIT